MKINLIMIAKSQEGFITEGFDIYKKRLSNYLPFKQIIIPALKNSKNFSARDFKEKEGELILKKIGPQDFTVLLDENGKMYDSLGFSAFMQQRMNTGIKTLNFVVGGAYGFSDAVYQKANTKISLSKMTFSHQVIRIIFMEQLYRAMTILNNEPYHNQ